MLAGSNVREAVKLRNFFLDERIYQVSELNGMSAYTVVVKNINIHRCFTELLNASVFNLLLSDHRQMLNSLKIYYSPSCQPSCDKVTCILFWAMNHGHRS